MKAAPFARNVRTFARQEDGALLTYWTLVTLAGMLLFTGMAYDVVRAEVTRTKMQNTLDRAILAAADLDQTLAPETVVGDYMSRSGMENFVIDVSSDTGLNFKTVEASTGARVKTQFMRMAQVPELETFASGTANETITDVEISLVLDNSGSMNSNNRLNLLKDAASDFVDIVIGDTLANYKVSINVVPFATQVSAGPDLLEHFNVTDEHEHSHCVNFTAADFTRPELSQTTQLQRTGHFDVQSWAKPLQNRFLTCPTDENRHIMVMESSKDALKDKINGMWAGGNTSIDVATKWGLALLDPAARPIVNAKIDDNDVTDDFRGRPYDYDEPQVMKVLVVMSDGENTSQYMLRNQYRSGESPLFRDRENGRESYYHNRSSTSYDYYYLTGDYWRQTPYVDWSRAERLDWTEVWASRSVANYARYVQSEAIGGSWSSYYYSYWTSVSPSAKNTRTSQICQAAKDQNIVVYTIGMDTYGQGDATLSDCATSSAYFFDVDGLEIGQAFAAIARDINRLRLTH